MSAELSELDALLNTVSAEQGAASLRTLADLTQADRRGPAVIYRCAATWSTRAQPRHAEHMGPAHQTLRRRGLAPRYPRPIDLTRGHPGELVMLREGLALEPADARTPCTHISADSIQRVLFYADCLEITHGSMERTLVCCDGIEMLDLKFEAHYGR
jgi:hypothetical protein